MRSWLFVGSSKHVIEHCRIAYERYSPLTTITTNRGAKAVERPDYYFLTEQGGPEWMWEWAAQMQTQGTRLVTWPREIDWFDITLDKSKKAEEGGYLGLTNSGMLCLAFACNMGAERLVLAGCEGYDETTAAVSYFDDQTPVTGKNQYHVQYRPSPNKAVSINKYVLGPQTSLLCRTWPNVEFICLGEPCYKMDEGFANWKVEPCQ